MRIIYLSKIEEKLFFLFTLSEYTGLIHEELLCNLWTELEQLSANNKPKPVETLQAVNCKYDDYDDNSEDLCELWCALQEYQGFRLI